MQNKKLMLLFSFTLAAVLVLGTLGFSNVSEANADTETNSMMNMMNGDGMMNMMEAMNSPEGQEMLEGCSKFMSSYSEKEEL